jgi:hypothetical protein
MDCHEEKIEVLYNSGYGGYGLSDKAKKMFEERKTNEKAKSVSLVRTRHTLLDTRAHAHSNPPSE